MQVRVSIRTCMPNLGAVRRERFLTIYNPLNPPGVGWVKLKKIMVRVSIRIREQTCRLPSKLPLGSRQVAYLALGSRRVSSPENCRWGADRSAIWRWGADLSAPQPIVVGEPTGRFPRKLPLGDRHSIVYLFFRDSTE